MIMDYISSLRVEVVDERTPIFDEVMEELRGVMYNAMFRIGLILSAGDDNTPQEA